MQRPHRVFETHAQAKRIKHGAWVGPGGDGDRPRVPGGGWCARLPAGLVLPFRPSAERRLEFPPTKHVVGTRFLSVEILG